MAEPIIGNIDLAQVSLYLFWLFFAGLVYYLQRENMREGYPLEDEDGNVAPNTGPFPLPSPKTFKLPHGRGEVTVPDMKPEARELALVSNGPGNPLDPSGDPMKDGVGPASWAPRRDVPELDGHGHQKIVPMASMKDFFITGGKDPRGLPVVSCDGETVASVVDMWVDGPEQLVRYLEIDLAGNGGRRLLPITLACIWSTQVSVHSLNASQFPGVPETKARNQVTLLEEDKICAYYCGGKLYADPARMDLGI